jgi:hypothetical protein
MQEEIPDNGDTTYTVGKGAEEISISKAETGLIVSDDEYRFYLYR